LEIMSHILGVNSESNLLFALVVHSGTVLSTIVVFWKDIIRLIKGLFKFEMNPETEFMLKIFISLIPVLVIGLTLKDEVESLFGGSLLIVGCMLVVTAALLLFSSIAKPRVKGLTYKNAFWIGVAQAVAVLPGLSRSGSTISTGLLLGVKKEDVARFSFLMVLIPIIGINFLDVMKGDFGGDIPVYILLGGFLSSFIAGTIACKWMIKVVSRGKLYYFSAYCFVVGSITIIHSLFF
ncbi:MAG: undecaprenyl-diphosphate phosphatase, partial [Rikenellaceae bacterium]